MISLQNVCKEYPNGVKALNDVTLNIDSFGIVAIVGKSGSGKSTLLNMLGALDKPTSGKVFIDGEDVSAMSDKQLSKLRNERVGFVFQSFYLEPTLSVEDNVCVPLMIKGTPKKEREERALKLLEAFKIGGKSLSRASQLSGGEKQRVAIARALANDAKIILCDEPTGNLDSENSQVVLHYLKHISADRTVILITHNEDDAKKYAGRIIRLSDGKIVEDYENDPD